MGWFSRKPKPKPYPSNLRPSESSRPPQSSQPFNYAQYPDDPILNMGGEPARFPSSNAMINGYPGSQINYHTHQPPPPLQQSIYQISQQPGYHDNNYPSQPTQHNTTPYQPRYPPAPAHHDPHPSAYLGSSRQQQVVVNVIPNTQTSSYRHQPQYQQHYPQHQQQQPSQGIPRCRAGHLCVQRVVESDENGNRGRLYWRCLQCRKFVVFDDER